MRSRLIALALTRHVFKRSLISAMQKICSMKMQLREKCPNTEFFLVRIQEKADQKKLRICTLFTQCAGQELET